VTKLFAKNLPNKKVMTTDGGEIGTLANITMDLRTGSLLELLIKPDLALDTEQYETDGKYILLPFHAVRAIKDYIVVDQASAKKSTQK